MSRIGAVRADTQTLADQVATMVDELQPRVAELLPDSREESLEVWIQEEPMLYRFMSRAYEEADGFWAESPGRIHLRRDADDLRRTLAHELTHATLGESWHLLPGTIEEGLCDYVSVKLCPEGAPAMRAGRLSAASFAIGGLELELELTQEDSSPGEAQSYAARILLQSGGPDPLNPMDVFEVSAGLSTTTLNTPDKKALYGLSYVLVDRIAERHGLLKLHDLCVQAELEGESTIPIEWLLDAADLDSNPATWQRAIAGSLGEAELQQLVAMYPRFVEEALSVCERTFPPLFTDENAPPLRLDLSLPSCPASIVLAGIGATRSSDQDLALIRP